MVILPSFVWESRNPTFYDFYETFHIFEHHLWRGVSKDRLRSCVVIVLSLVTVTLASTSVLSTVGQRKKVTAVTFFPARPRLDQTAQIRTKYTKFPLMKSRDFLVYRMDVIRSQLTANTGIPVCLFREIWQFKVFTGKEVTPLHEEGNSLQFRAGKKATHFHYKWFTNK